MTLMPVTVFLGRLAVAVAVFTACYALGLWAAEKGTVGTVYAAMFTGLGAVLAILILSGWHPERRPGEDTDNGEEVRDGEP